MITDMNIRFLAPCTSELNVEARVIKTGRSLSPVAVYPYDASRPRIAVTQATDILFGAVKTDNEAE
jgi:acyl-coenzyme A thioesterase PaaI-like protein